MARYLKVTFRDSINCDNYNQYRDPSTWNPSDWEGKPTKGFVVKSLKKYAKSVNDKSISFNNFYWLKEEIGWELFFDRVAYYDSSECPETWGIEEYVELGNYPIDFPEGASKNLELSVVHNKPKTIPIRGKFTIVIYQQEYIVGFKRLVY